MSAIAYLQRLPAEVCVYCKGEAQTRDHVVARTVLGQPLPLHTYTVPACHKCNGEYGLDEEYFVAVLGMIGRTPEIEKRVAENADIYRILEHSQKLDERLVSSVVLLPGLEVPPILSLEQDRIHTVVQKIAFGLYLAKFRPNNLPPLSDFRPVPIEKVRLIEKMNITPSFRLRRWTVIKKDVFEYVFFRSWIEPYVGIRFCLMRFYGSTFLAAVRCP